MPGLNCEIGWKTRLCEVNGELGRFHIWEQWSNMVDASPLRGGHPGGQIGLRQGVPVFEEDWRCECSMTKTEKLDEFLKRTDIELLPFQREMLSQIADGNKIYICYPPHVGRTNTILLM